VRDRLEWLGVLCLRAILRLLPEPAAFAAGRGLGRALHGLGVRRRVARANLQRACGATASPAEIDRLCLRCYEHAGMTAAEVLRLSPRVAARHAATSVVHGLEHVEAALQHGRGVVVASAHYGNWEVLAPAMQRRGIGVCFVVQRLRNASVDALLQRVRRDSGVHVLERGMAMRRVAEHLSANRLVCLMCDQDARRRGVFVPFFGVPASTPKGPAQLALRHGVPFVPVFGRRVGAHHEIRFHPAIDPGPGANEEARIGSMMLRFNQVLEATIRAEPAQYLWLHRRWKTAPPA
jgi:KDO2-lipid IV(A) lauroyltransferase